MRPRDVDKRVRREGFAPVAGPMPMDDGERARAALQRVAKRRGGCWRAVKRWMRSAGL